MEFIFITLEVPIEKVCLKCACASCGRFVQVKWHGEHVPGSPFFVMIFDTQQELDRFLNGQLPSPTPPTPFIPPGWMGPPPPGIFLPPGGPPPHIPPNVALPPVTGPPPMLALPPNNGHPMPLPGPISRSSHPPQAALVAPYGSGTLHSNRYPFFKPKCCFLWTHVLVCHLCVIVYVNLND